MGLNSRTFGSLNKVNVNMGLKFLTTYPLSVQLELLAHEWLISERVRKRQPSTLFTRKILPIVDLEMCAATPPVLERLRHSLLRFSGSSENCLSTSFTPVRRAARLSLPSNKFIIETI